MRRLLLIATAAAAIACATNGAASGGSASLDGRRWQLAELEGQAAIGAGTPRAPYITFAADSSRASGSASCNRFSGPYTRDGDKLEFGALMSTKMACADNAMNQQESQFLSALGNTRSHAVRGDTLWLKGASANTLAILVSGGP